MGFSVSGAAAIIFAGMFIAFGMWYTASANSFEQVTEAQTDRADTVLETSNSAVEISATEYVSGNLTVAVNNTGASQLSVSDTDLLVDGRYEGRWNESVVAGDDPDTDLWLAGEQLTITVELPEQPDRVKVVAETGVSDTAEVPYP
jgi:flagellar protein FlaF